MQQHGGAAHVAVGERLGADAAALGSSVLEVEHLGAQADERRQVEPGEIGAVGVAVERAVEVGAGVADHRDDVHRELGARRVLRAGVLPREVRRDRRRGQAGVGDEPGADRVAEVDDACRRSVAAAADLDPAAAAVRLLDDLAGRGGRR